MKKIAGGHMQDLKRRILEMQSMVATLEHLTHRLEGANRTNLSRSSAE